MLDEKRIRQMTKLAFSKKEEKNALRIGRYFRSDYIGKELLKNFFWLPSDTFWYLRLQSYIILNGWWTR